MNLDRSAAGVRPHQEAASVVALARKGPAGGDDAAESGASPFQSMLQALDPAVAFDAAGIHAAPEPSSVVQPGDEANADPGAAALPADQATAADPAAVPAQLTGLPFASAAIAPVAEAQVVRPASRAGVMTGALGVGGERAPARPVFVVRSGDEVLADLGQAELQVDQPMVADPAALLEQMPGLSSASAPIAPGTDAQVAGPAGFARVMTGALGVGGKGHQTQRESSLQAAADSLDARAGSAKLALDAAALSATGKAATRGTAHALALASNAGEHARRALVQAGDARVGAELRAPDVTSVTAPQAGVGAVLGASMFESGAVIFRGGLTPTRPGERAPARASQPSLAASMAGPWADLGITGTSNAANPVFAVNAAGPAPELALADKLNYWVGRGVQHAVLQLDAFGGGSVDVGISVQGNEAMVEFRTDQFEARRLLQDAMPQLKEMLKGQGLELAGGFVGTSAQHERGGQGFGAQQPGIARSLSVRMQATDAVRASDMSATHGRTVDLFV